MYNLIGTGPRESCEFKCQSQARSCLGTFATSRLVGGGGSEEEKDKRWEERVAIILA